LGVTPTGVQSVVVATGGDTASLTYSVSARQPGNNWKVVAHCSQTYLNGIVLDTSTAARGTNFLDASAGTVSNQFQTPLMSVWRMLHVELDSMASVPAYPDSQANIVRGQITKVLGNQGTPSYQCEVNQNLDDGSSHLNSNPSRNGRFENGTITIGTGTGVANTGSFLGNGKGAAGNNYVKAKTSLQQKFNIPFVMTKTLLLPVNGGVVSFNQDVPAGQSSFFTDTGMGNGVYNGGTFTVTGHGFSTLAVTNKLVVTPIQFATLDFELRDDDVNSVVPYDINAKKADIETVLKEKYNPSYINPTIDGGGNSNNNTADVPFQRNLSEAGLSSSQGDANRSDDFWVAYVLMGFQALPFYSSINRGDNDPNSELVSGGVTSYLQAPSSLVLLEELRDDEVEYNRAPEEKHTVTHEIAHQFGLSDCDPCPGDFMGPDFLNAGAAFSAAEVDLLRRRLKSPGRTQ